MPNDKDPEGPRYEGKVLAKFWQIRPNTKQQTEENSVE